MNNNLEFENEDPSPDSIEDNHPRTNYGEGYGGKETLEEAAKTFATRFTSRSTLNWESFKLGFIEGAKWQQERMYSEKEVKQILNETLIEYSDYVLDDIPEWFRQFKKK